MKAEPLTPEMRAAAYADALSFHAMRERIRRLFNNLGWIVGAVGATYGIAASIAVVIVLPLKTTEVRWIRDDVSTGNIQYGLTAEEAAPLFGPKEAAHFLQQYIDVREGYDPHVDQRHWEVVREMSSPEVFANYVAWRKSDTAPVKQLGTAGHIKITGADFSAHGKDGDTFEYTVRYRRQEIRDDAVGPVRAMSNVIAFQWHPRAVMSLTEAIDNPGGMTVVSYSDPRTD